MFSTNKVRSLDILLLVALFIYVLVRTICIDYTFDEIWTCNVFVKGSVLNIISLNPCDANNHILNSLSIKILFYLFGDNPFVSRLPNVLAFAFYLYFAYQVSSMLNSFAIRSLLLALLCLNPFCLDFFGLARGYGLALCFALGSIYHLLRYLGSFENQFIVLSSLYIVLAVLSNFSFFPLIVALGPILFAIVLYNSGFKIAAIFSAFYLLAGLMIFLLLNKLRLHGNLYYGGSNGFFDDTVKSLINFSCGNKLSGHKIDETFLYMVSLFLVLYLVVIIALNTFYFSFRNKSSYAPIVLSIILLLVVWSIVSQHAILHTLFPIDRTAIYLLPLYSLTLCFNMESLHGCKGFKLPVLGFATTLIIIVLLNFISNANFYKTITWDFESHTRAALKFIDAKGAREGKVYRTDFSWPLNNAIGYYLNKKEYAHIIKSDKVNRDNICSECDFYLLVDRDLPLVGFRSQEDTIRKKFVFQALAWNDESVFLLEK